MFNTVVHKHLLDTQERRFGIRDFARKWHTSYLAELTQTFQVGTDKSKTFAVNCSLPQGSVLGPLKFIAYTEYLSSVVDEYNVNTYFYADDGQLNDIFCCPTSAPLYQRWRTVWMLCTNGASPNIFN